MSKLVIARGVPASGKSTFGKELAGQGFTVINRDSIRFSLYGKYWGVNEDVVTEVENAALVAALRAGEDVYLDATNLTYRFVRTKLSLAARWGAEVEFCDFPISLEEAVARDAARPDRQVGRDVIKGFFLRFKIDKDRGTLPQAPDPLPVFEPYVGNPNLPGAYIVDTDGTVALHEPHRDPYDTTKYHLDTLNKHVAITVRALSEYGYPIIGLSGRDAEFEGVTLGWWEQNDIPWDEFYFRPKGDRRIDSLIKYELFNEHIRDRYHVLGAFDDRPQVIRMWETIGVPVFNVGDGREF